MVLSMIIYIIDGIAEELGEDGFAVLKKLSQMGKIGIEDPKLLIELLKSIKRENLICRVRDFMEKCEIGRL